MRRSSQGLEKERRPMAEKLRARGWRPVAGQSLSAPVNNWIVASHSAFQTYTDYYPNVPMIGTIDLHRVDTGFMIDPREIYSAITIHRPQCQTPERIPTIQPHNRHQTNAPFSRIIKMSGSRPELQPVDSVSHPRHERQRPQWHPTESPPARRSPSIGRVESADGRRDPIAMIPAPLKKV